MATSKWSLLEIVQRVCEKINMPPPTDLSNAEIASNEAWSHMIDVVNYVVDSLVKSMWPEEVIKHDKIWTVAPQELTVTVANGSASVTLDSGNISTSLTYMWIRISGYEVPFRVTDIPGSTTITMENNWPGSNASGQTAYFYKEGYALPTDFDRPVSSPKKFLPVGDIDFVSPEVYQNQRFGQTAANEGTYLPGKPAIATIFTDSDGTHYLALKPFPDAVIPIEIQYYSLIAELVPDGDADSLYTAIPASHQHILIPAIIRELFAYKMQDPRWQQADADLRERMSHIVGSKDESRGVAQITPMVHQARRRLFAGGSSKTRLAAKYHLGDYFDWLV